MVTSTADNCLGSECPFWDDCFVVQARQRAQAADLVVVNHHLLLADLALKQEGFGEILPGAQAFVVDEAHQLPELAAQFFGEGLGARPLVELARDCAGRMQGPPARWPCCRRRRARWSRPRARCARRWRACRPRGTRWRALQVPAVFDGLDALATRAAARCSDALAPLREASPGFDACHGARARANARGCALGGAGWLGEAANPSMGSAAADADAARFAVDETMATTHRPGPRLADDRHPRGVRRALVRTVAARLPPAAHAAGRVRAAAHASRAIARGLGVHLGDAGGGRRLRPSSPRGWAWTRRDTLLEPSPFDWPRQALCYLPRACRSRTRATYTGAVIDAVRPVLEASGGRAFLLFASHRALREAAELLRGGPWPLFVQGEAPRTVLLQRFRDSGNGVLLGAASFREGVDVAGDALSVVVIDKLPFAAPDDPVFEARLDAIRRAGGNPFRDEQLPQAVIALKQGVGRLIRTETDRGVLVLCDPRLIGKSYGRCSSTRCRRSPPFCRCAPAISDEVGRSPSIRSHVQ
jgi:ATP-dependent DNA helicase DinG